MVKKGSKISKNCRKIAEIDSLEFVLLIFSSFSECPGKVSKAMILEFRLTDKNQT